MTEFTKENFKTPERLHEEPPAVLTLLMQEIERLGSLDEMVVPDGQDLKWGTRFACK